MKTYVNMTEAKDNNNNNNMSYFVYVFPRIALWKPSQTCSSCLFWRNLVKTLLSSNLTKLLLNWNTLSVSFVSSGSSPLTTILMRGSLVFSARYAFRYRRVMWVSKRTYFSLFTPHSCSLCYFIYTNTCTIFCTVYTQTCCSLPTQH